MAGTEMQDTGAPESDAAATRMAKWRLLVAACVVIAGIALAVGLATRSGHGAPVELVTVADDQGPTSTTTVPEPTSVSTSAAAPEDSTTTTNSPSPRPTTAGGGSGPPPAPMTRVAPTTIAPPPPPPVVDTATQVANCIADQEAWGRTQLARVDAKEKELADAGIQPTPEQQARFDEQRYEGNFTIHSANQYCNLKFGQ